MNGGSAGKDAGSWVLQTPDDLFLNRAEGSFHDLTVDGNGYFAALQ